MKQTSVYLQKEIHKSIFFYDYIILSKGKKSQLKEYRIPKKVESKPENKLDYLQRLYRQFFQNHLNCSYLKEKIEVHSIYHSDIEIKI